MDRPRQQQDMEDDDDDMAYNSNDEYAYDDDDDDDGGDVGGDDHDYVPMTDTESKSADRTSTGASPHGATSSSSSSSSAAAATSSSSSSSDGHTRGRSGSTFLLSVGKVPDGKYVVTEYTEVVPWMDAVVKEVATLLEMDAGAAQILLQHVRWDKERLMDAFFADPEKSLADAGLDLYTSAVGASASATSVSASASASATTATSTTLFSCRICCDELSQRNALCLGCEHRFCRPCYAEYLKHQVSDGPACIQARCPEHKCHQRVPPGFFHALLDPMLAAKYSTYVLRNFIETSKTMRYCPAAGCDKVAVGSGVTTVRCACTHPFCFRCGEEAHDPCSCAQLSEWATKCMNESETANWILANTKKCPKCNTRIEKNQGCNHMNCKLCKHEFCWICMGNWVDHGQTTGGFYRCNRYDAGKPPEGSTEKQRAKLELDRYLHYYQRFHGHDSALKFAAGQREQAERKMVERQEAHRSTWIDVQFLKHAAEQVIDCRRVLKYTYVLGYFLEDASPEKQLFEHHQELLEKNTEKLHEYTEQALDAIDRTQVVNLTRVTERFMASLLASMAGGVVNLAAGVASEST